MGADLAQRVHTAGGRHVPEAHDPLTARCVRPTRAYGVGLAGRNGGHQSTNSVIGDFAGAESSHVAGRPSVNRRFGKRSRSASMPTAISVLANTAAMQL